MLWLKSSRRLAKYFKRRLPEGRYLAFVLYTVQEIADK